METITIIGALFILFTLTFLFALSLGKYLERKNSRLTDISYIGYDEGFGQGFKDAQKEMKDLINALTVREMLEHKRNKLKGLIYTEEEVIIEDNTFTLSGDFDPSYDPFLKE